MAERSSPQSFYLTAGESFELAFTADAEVTGATVQFWVARTKGGMPVLSTESSPATATGSVTGDNTFRVNVTDENTDGLLGTYHYGVKLVDVFGNESWASHGYLTFDKPVA